MTKDDFTPITKHNLKTYCIPTDTQIIPLSLITGNEKDEELVLLPPLEKYNEMMEALKKEAENE